LHGIGAESINIPSSKTLQDRPGVDEAEKILLSRLEKELADTSIGNADLGCVGCKQVSFFRE
jgi:hypothetical protein